MRNLYWTAAVVSPALFLTWLFWPGIFFSDSSARWMAALLFLRKIPEASWPLDTSFPPAMTLLMAAVYDVTGSLGAFTALQALVFFTSLAMLLRALLGSGRRALVGYVIVVLLPVLWIFSVFVTSDTWTASGLNATLALLFAPWPGRRPQQAAHAMGFFLAAWVLFSFRHNSLTVVPVVLFILFRIFREDRSRARTLGVGLVAALVVTAAIPSLFRFHRVDLASVIVTWEYVGTLRVLNDPTVLSEHNLDFLGGSTQLAVASHKWTTCDSLLWGHVFQTNTILQNSQEVRRRFQRLVRAHPGAWLVQKTRVALAVLGVTHSPGQLRRQDTAPRFAREHGIWYDHAPDSGTFLAIAVSNEINGALAWTLRPAFDLLIVLLLLMMCRRRGVLPPRAGTLLAAAVFYYGGFVVVAAANDFRYYFPSFVLLLVLAIVAVHALLANGSKPLPRSRQGRDNA